MAKTLSLYDNSDSPITLNLLSASGYNAVYDTFKQAIPTDVNTVVIDTFQVTLEAASDDALAAQLIILGRMLRRAAQYKNDDTQTQEILLYAQLSAETNQRIAPVLGGSFSLNAGLNTPQVVSSHIAYLTIAIEHLPWETSGTVITATGVSSLGGGINVSAGTVGDLPGRAHLNYFRNANAAMTVDKLWCGFRSRRKHKANANFQSFWEAEEAGYGTIDLSFPSGDSSASNSAYANVAFTYEGTSLIERLAVLAVDAVADPLAHSGRFLVLARMRLSAGSDPVNAQIRSGWYAPTVTPGFKYNDIVAVTGTDWKLYEMGSVKFPPASYSGVMSAAVMNDVAISLLAQRTSGTTSQLQIDGFGLLPIDEGFAKVSDLYLVFQNDGVHIRMTRKGTSFVARNNLSSLLTAVTEFTMQDFYTPFDDEVYLYHFAQRIVGGSVIGDTISFSGTFFPRFQSLRGAV